MKKPQKADNWKVTPELLKQRVAYAQKLGFGKQKWVYFCEVMLQNGFKLSLYEARRTVSKYISVKGNGKVFKVRFSNHKPIEQREIAGDCDFFVGRTNLKTTTTDDAIRETLNFLKKEQPFNPIKL